MGLLRLAATVGIALFGYLYPSYATFKALAGRPATEPQIEGWAFYWSVVGILVAAEELFEWFFNWIPLYYEAKFFFILWLVSPGTQGANYLYKTYLQPFYESNTQNIDTAIASARVNALGFIQSTIAAIWAFVISRVTNAQTATNQNAGPAPGQPGNPAQNNLNEAVNGMWKQWGPAVLSAGANILSPARNAAAAQQGVANQPIPTPSPGVPLTPRSVPTPAANTPTPETDQLRYRSSAVPNEGRNTPPPAFPTPQHV